MKYSICSIHPFPLGSGRGLTDSFSFHSITGADTQIYEFMGINLDTFTAESIQSVSRSNGAWEIKVFSKEFDFRIIFLTPTEQINSFVPEDADIENVKQVVNNLLSESPYHMWVLKDNGKEFSENYLETVVSLVIKFLLYQTIRNS